MIGVYRQTTTSLQYKSYTAANNTTICQQHQERKTRARKGKPSSALEKQELDRIRRGWIFGDPHTNFTRRTIQCDHGSPYFPVGERDHPVANFMDAYFVNWLHKEMGSLNAILEDLFSSHRGVYSSDYYRDMVVKIFTRIGTNMLLTEQFSISNPVNIANAITVIEHYSGTGDIDETLNCRAVHAKIRDLDPDSSSCKRDVLKFFSKRTSCSCLKAKYAKARKSAPKMGICFGCGKEKERALLDVCSRCMVTQFCSRECQVANWDKHRDDCDLMCSDQATY